MPAGPAWVRTDAAIVVGLSDRVRDDGSSAGLRTTWQCPGAVTIAPVTIAFVHAKLGSPLVESAKHAAGHVRLVPGAVV